MLTTAIFTCGIFPSMNIAQGIFMLLFLRARFSSYKMPHEQFLPLNLRISGMKIRLTSNSVYKIIIITAISFPYNCIFHSPATFWNFKIKYARRIYYSLTLLKEMYKYFSTPNLRLCAKVFKQNNE